MGSSWRNRHIYFWPTRHILQYQHQFIMNLIAVIFLVAASMCSASIIHKPKRGRSHKTFQDPMMCVGDRRRNHVLFGHRVDDSSRWHVFKKGYLISPSDRRLLKLFFGTLWTEDSLSHSRVAQSLWRNSKLSMSLSSFKRATAILIGIKRSKKLGIKQAVFS